MKFLTFKLEDGATLIIPECIWAAVPSAGSARTRAADLNSTIAELEAHVAGLKHFREALGKEYDKMAAPKVGPVVRAVLENTSNAKEAEATIKEPKPCEP